jgi:hypothetical protein
MLFFVGLHRTGTHTQAELAHALGLDVAHDHRWPDVLNDSGAYTYERPSPYRAKTALTANAFSDGGGHTWDAQYEFGAAAFDLHWLARCWPSGSFALIVRPLRSWLVSKSEIMHLNLPISLGKKDRLANCAERSSGQGGPEDNRYSAAVGRVVSWIVFREFYHRRAIEFFQRELAADNGDSSGVSVGGGLRWVVADLVSDIDATWRALQQLAGRTALRKVATPGALHSALPAKFARRRASARANSTGDTGECHQRVVDDALAAVNLDNDVARNAQILAFPEHQGLLRAWNLTVSSGVTEHQGPAAREIGAAGVAPPISTRTTRRRARSRRRR